MYPGFARVGALIGALALFAGMSICTNTTPPRKAHSAARPAPEESPERRLRRFRLKAFVRAVAAQRQSVII